MPPVGNLFVGAWFVIAQHGNLSKAYVLKPHSGIHTEYCEMQLMFVLVTVFSLLLFFVCVCDCLRAWCPRPSTVVPFLN